MTAPGVNIQETDPAKRPRSPLATDGLFVVAPAQRGPIGVLELTPRTVDKLGDPIAGSQMRESADWYFQNGGQYIAFSRLVGPNPTFGGTTLKDAGAVNNALTFAVREPGDWTTGWESKVVVVSGNTVKVQFFDPDGDLFLETPGFDSAAAFAAWSAIFDDDIAPGSEFVKFTDPGGAHWPPVQAAATAFATQGDDDVANVTDTERAAAAARLATDYGIGQFVFLGDTTETTHALAGAHVAANNRVALNALPDTSTKATLTAASLADRAGLSKDAARRSGDFGGSWIKTPGASPVDAPLTLPPEVAVAAKCAQNDLAGVSISQPPAGAFGDLPGALGLSQPQPAFPLEQDRSDLNEASANIFRVVGGSVKIYGFRSLTDPAADPAWALLSSARTVMLVEAIIKQIGEQNEFANVDAEGVAAGVMQARIDQELTKLWKNKRALFGTTKAEAFTVQVTGDPANRRFTSAVTLTVTPAGETVNFTVTNTPVGG